MPPPSDVNLFHAGLARFNAGEYFAAHEIWEELWHATTGPHKRFVQGLIQCAVALEHVRRGNPRGVRSVWQSAQTKFAGLPEVCAGLHIPHLLTAMARFLQPILALPPAAFAPGQGHGLPLPVDLAHAPRLTLEPDAGCH